jgi:hypothetical protein
MKLTDTQLILMLLGVGGFLYFMDKRKNGKDITQILVMNKCVDQAKAMKFRNQAARDEFIDECSGKRQA